MLSSADTILGLYAGVGQWQASFSGDIGEKGNTTTLNDLGHDKEPATQFWANFEHPIPLIPNIRVMSTQINSQATTTQSQDFRLGGVAIEVSDEIYTEMDLTHVDGTLYYEVLDNWVSLDVGITARLFSGYMEARSTTTGQEIAKGELDGVLPMLYLNARFDLPFTGWHLGAQSNAISYSGNGVTEMTGLIGYEMDFVALDVGLNVGYRTMSLKVEDLDDLYADAEVSGAFAELQVHF